MQGSADGLEAVQIELPETGKRELPRGQDLRPAAAAAARSVTTYQSANFVTRATHGWLGGVMKLARRGELEERHLELPPGLDTERAYVRFREFWQAEVAAHAARPSLLRALRKCYAGDLARAAMCRLVWSSLLMVAAFFCVRELVKVMSQTDTASRVYGYALAGVFFVACFGMSVADQMFSRIVSRQSLSMRAALSVALFRKALRLENAALFSTHVLNLVSNDCSRIMEGCGAVHELWASPVEAVVIVALLTVLIGLFGLLALVLVVGCILLQMYLGRRVAAMRDRSTEVADERMRLMQEVLAAVKLVKFYAWTRSFFDRVQALRRREMRVLRSGSVIKSVNLTVVFAVPPIIAFIMFVLYTWRYAALSATVAFTTLSLFNTLRFPLVVLPTAVQGLTAANASVKRVQAFLLLGESPPSQQAQSTDPCVLCEDVTVGYVNKVERAAGVEDDADDDEDAAAALADGIMDETIGDGGAGTLSRRESGLQHALERMQEAEQRARVPEGMRLVEVVQHVSFALRKGQVMAMVGAVSSGKSSILNAILGEARVARGNMTVRGRLAYVPQTPWVQAGTLRDNILFGQPYDEARYRAVVHACALEPDCAALPDGDRTVAAERGVNLSGGQRQRVSLARACYCDSDIYLLDNPLSAVDWHTSDHIVRHCIRGLLRGKTVLLVTHQLDILHKFDLVAIVADRTVAYFGPPNVSAVRQHFVSAELADAETMAPSDEANGEAGGAVHAADAADAHTHATTAAAAADADLQGERKQPDEPVVLTGAVVADAGTEADVDVPVGGTGTKAAAKANADDDAKDVDDAEGEHARRASQRAHDLFPPAPRTNPVLVWLRTGGMALGVVAVVEALITQVARIVSDWWIGAWTDDLYSASDMLYQLVYLGFVVLFTSLLFLRGTLFYHFAARGAARLHNRMLARVLHAPMAYFTLTPLGRLLNAFSNDQEVVDSALPDSLHMTMIYLMILITTVALICITVPAFVILAVLLIAFTVAIARMFLRPSAALKELVSARTAPLFAHLSESLDGIAVVRAFRSVPRFERDSVLLLDRLSCAAFYTHTSTLWLGLRLDFVGSLVVAITAVACVYFRGNGVEASAAGLAISNSLQMLVFYTWMVRGLAEAAVYFSSVSSAYQLAAGTPQEPPAVIPTHRPPPRWPSQGAVEFRGVVMRYLPWMEPALRGVTLELRAGEKVGVVGRTGSGKSSLIMALFRMYAMDAGEVWVDGQDLGQFGVEDVRSSLAIIPQEPVMFHGTVRSNVDPFGLHSDEEVWRALEVSFMKTVVLALPGQLAAAVEDNGVNFSLGQRQLICLSRAFLSESPILVLDEATAAMDLDTDALIQRTIRDAFADRTVITIAHRLDTVITSDRILVMDFGTVAEFAPPLQLLDDPASSFSRLVAQAGSHRDTLVELARQADEARQRAVVQPALERRKRRAGRGAPGWTMLSREATLTMIRSATAQQSLRSATRTTRLTVFDLASGAARGTLDEVFAPLGRTDSTAQQ